MIVVTGGAGFIGSVLAWKLNKIGHEDLLIVDQAARGTVKWKNLARCRYIDYLEHDDFLSKLESGVFTGKIEGIFHLGAITDTTERDRAVLTRNNVEYSRRLAEWALSQKVRFLYASSAATYGDGEHGYSDEDALTLKLKPLNPYGESKQQFDLWSLRERHEKQITGFKFFNVFGPHEYHKGRMRSMIHKGFGQAKEEGRIRLFKSYRPDYADGAQERDFVYVKDVVDVIAWFWVHADVKGIFNVGSGRACSWNDLARAIFKGLGMAERIEYIPMPESIRGQYQYHTQADLSKLRRVGCDVPFQSLEDAVEDYVKGYLIKEDPYL